MFAHQVIEDLKYRLMDLRGSPNLYGLDFNGIREWEKRLYGTINMILNSQHFYFGEASSLFDSISGGCRKESFFTGSMSAVENPYYMTTLQFDFHLSRIKNNINENLLKKMLLVVKSNNNLLHVRPVSIFENERFSVSDFDLIIDKDRGEFTYDLVRNDEKLIEKYNKLAPFDLFLGCTNTALLLLSCKNITTETHDPPAKLNKARQKRGKQPLFTYHTLILKPVGKKQESIPKHLWNNRIHLQRGHFKTYTQDAPLFGSITGRFWWQPHVRGQNREGVVMKDYEVRQ